MRLVLIMAGFGGDAQTTTHTDSLLWLGVAKSCAQLTAELVFPRAPIRYFSVLVLREQGF